MQDIDNCIVRKTANDKRFLISRLSSTSDLNPPFVQTAAPSKSSFSTLISILPRRDDGSRRND
jgi:hypothetical protein